MAQRKNNEITKDVLISPIQAVVNERITLKSNISLDDWLALKKAVNPINNFITTELTIRFIKLLPNLFKNISEKEVESLVEKQNKINVNETGYDFRYDEKQIIAEVKGNIPYEKNKYGSSQFDGITKDINALMKGKKKGGLANPNEYYKFLVLLEYKKGDYDTDKAIKNLMERKIGTNCERLVVSNNGSRLKLRTQKVYIVTISV